MIHGLNHAFNHHAVNGQLELTPSLFSQSASRKSAVRKGRAFGLVVLSDFFPCALQVPEHEFTVTWKGSLEDRITKILQNAGSLCSNLCLTTFDTSHSFLLRSLLSNPNAIAREGIGHLFAECRTACLAVARTIP